MTSTPAKLKPPAGSNGGYSPSILAHSPAISSSSGHDVPQLSLTVHIWLMEHSVWAHLVILVPWMLCPMLSAALGCARPHRVGTYSIVRNFQLNTWASRCRLALGLPSRSGCKLAGWVRTKWPLWYMFCFFIDAFIGHPICAVPNNSIETISTLLWLSAWICLRVTLFPIWWAALNVHNAV